MECDVAVLMTVPVTIQSTKDDRVLFIMNAISAPLVTGSGEDPHNMRGLLARGEVSPAVQLRDY